MSSYGMLNLNCSIALISIKTAYTSQARNFEIPQVFSRMAFHRNHLFSSSIFRQLKICLNMEQQHVIKKYTQTHTHIYIKAQQLFHKSVRFYLILDDYKIKGWRVFLKCQRNIQTPLAEVRGVRTLIMRCLEAVTSYLIALFILLNTWVSNESRQNNLEIQSIKKKLASCIFIINIIDDFSCHQLLTDTLNLFLHQQYYTEIFLLKV